MEIKVRVPATSANCGPGFDSMGVALSLYNYFTLTENYKEKSLKLTFSGIGAEMLEKEDPEKNLLVLAMKTILNIENRDLPRGTIHCQIDIPPARGLGSSATAIVAGLFIGNALLDIPLSKEELLQIASEMEGHPDNVCPAIFGGFCIAQEHQKAIYFRELFLAPQLKFVILVSDQIISTKEARKVLPSMLTYDLAVKNIGAASLLVTALERGEWDLLKVAMEDHLHVPYRLPLIKGGAEVFKAAYQAGAKGVTISGSGSSIIAYCIDEYEIIAFSMQEVMNEMQIKSQAYVLLPDYEGCTYL